MSEHVSKVVFATDFSETSERAAAWAVALCKAHNASLVLGHCLEGLVPGGFYFEDPSGRAYQEVTRAANERLQSAAEKLAAELGQDRIESQLIEGTPWRAVVQLVEDSSASLVVVGTRGLRGIDALLLGSTARSIIQHSPVPVLSIPRDAPAPGDGVTHLLGATDLSSGAATALGRSLDIFPGTQRMTVVHAYASPFLYTSYGSIPTTTDFLQDAKVSAEMELGKQIDSLREEAGIEGLQIDQVVTEGFPPDVITEAGAEGGPGEGAQVMVLGTAGRSGLAHMVLGSIAERTVTQAKLPVLTVHGH